MSDNAGTTEMQAEEDMEVALLSSRSTAAYELEELQELERACRESTASYRREVRARRREELVFEKAVAESFLRITGHRQRNHVDYREGDPPPATRRRRHRASVVVVEEVAE